jgi:hypothetical protein
LWRRKTGNGINTGHQENRASKPHRHRIQSAFSSLLSHRRPIKHPTQWLLSCRRRCWRTWWPSPMPHPRPSAAPAVSGDGQSPSWPAPEGETGTGDGGGASGCLRWRRSPAVRMGPPPKITTPFLAL